MRAESLRLDHVLQREIAIGWAEGVALVQAICRELPDAAASSARFPLAMEVAINANGGIELLRRPSGSPGVSAAGRLLGEMLQSDVPVRLRLIHSEAVAPTPAFHTIKDLSEALSYFERPDSAQLIQQLYMKASAIAETTKPSIDLVDMPDFLPESSPAVAVEAAPRPEPLRAVTHEPAPQRLAEHQPAPEQPYVAKPEARPRHANLMIAAGVVAFVVLASGAFLTYGGEQAEAPAAVDVENPSTADAAAKPTGTTSKASPAERQGASKRQQDTKTRKPAEPTVPPTVPPVAARATNAGSVRTSAANSPASTKTSALQPAVVPDPAWAATLPFIMREPVQRRLSVPPTIDETGELLYSRVNADVVPPTAIRPHLPSEPPANYPVDHLMVLELVITTKGDVESVRLLTLPRTVNDFMIVSAAKAWLFAPARLSGRAVKYKHRIRFAAP